MAREAHRGHAQAELRREAECEHQLQVGLGLRVGRGNRPSRTLRGERHAIEHDGQQRRALEPHRFDKEDDEHSQPVRRRKAQQ